MEKDKILRAVNRVLLLIKEPVLQQEPVTITVNAPVALYQLAFSNELNGILLGLGLPELRVVKLPIPKDKAQAIKESVKRLQK